MSEGEDKEKAREETLVRQDRRPRRIGHPSWLALRSAQRQIEGAGLLMVYEFAALGELPQYSVIYN